MNAQQVASFSQAVIADAKVANGETVGFSFDANALSLRLRTLMTGLNITTRAGLIQAWNGATAAQKVSFLGQLLFGAVRCPDDPNGATPAQIAATTNVT